MIDDDDDERSVTGVFKFSAEIGFLVWLTFGFVLGVAWMLL